MQYRMTNVRTRRVAHKYVEVTALDTPGAISITRVVPTIMRGVKQSIRKKHTKIYLEDKRMLKELAYGGVKLIEPEDRVIIVRSGRESQIVLGRNFDRSMREIASSALNVGFGGSGGSHILPGKNLPGILLKCPLETCAYRVLVYYYDPDNPPSCAVHPNKKMIPA